MYRLVRKIRARIKTQEIALLFVALAFAFLSGRAAGNWYVSAGRGNWLVSSVNKLGGGHGAGMALADGGTADAEAAGKRDLPALQNNPGAKSVESKKDDISSGFYSSARAGLLEPANGYSASYLALHGEGAVRSLEGALHEALAEPYDAEEDEAFAADAGLPDGQGGLPAELASTAGRDPGDAFDADDGGNVGDAGDAGGQPADTAPAEKLYTVKILYHGERHELMTASKKVSVLLEELGMNLTEDDKVSGAYLDGIIDSQLLIKIDQIKQKTIYEEIVIPAKTVYRDNADLGNGKTKTIRNGADGLKRIEYLITYKNGELASKTKIKEVIVTEAVSKIIEQGSSGIKVGKDGTKYKYSKIIDVKCTAYSNSYEDTGKRPGDPEYGVTKSGMKAKKGIVAVDPSVIPLGTKMYIEILDESIEDYGYAIAGDTGGKIKGKKVDLFFDASAEKIRQFGVRKAKVYILD